MLNRVAAVVVTFNRLDLLKKNIKALKKQVSSTPLDILLIDNASTDGTQDYIMSLKDKQIQYFNTGSNIGGAGGFNYGIRKAADLDYKWVWVMDDDTVPSPHALEALLSVECNLSDNYGFLVSRVLWKDGTQCLMNCPKYKYKKINQDELTRDITPITQASFVSLLMRCSTVRDVGLPIKEFFIWGDDVEYTRRIALIYQKKSFIVKDSVVYHLMSVNKGSSIAMDVGNRISRYRYAYRNEFYLYKKTGINDFFYYLMKCVFNFLKIIIFSKDFKVQRVKVLINAIHEGAHFNPNIERLK